MIAALGVNFALWGLSVIPAWFVVKNLGLDGKERDAHGAMIVKESDQKSAEA